MPVSGLTDELPRSQYRARARFTVVALKNFSEVSKFHEGVITSPKHVFHDIWRDRGTGRVLVSLAKIAEEDVWASKMSEKREARACGWRMDGCVSLTPTLCCMSTYFAIIGRIRHAPPPTFFLFPPSASLCVGCDETGALNLVTNAAFRTKQNCLLTFGTLRYNDF